MEWLAQCQTDSGMIFYASKSWHVVAGQVVQLIKCLSHKPEDWILGSQHHIKAEFGDTHLLSQCKQRQADYWSSFASQASQTE